MSRHIYHYHATFQLEPGMMHSIDGIALMGKKIEDMVDYHNLKASVAALPNNLATADKLVITSLSYLGEEQ